jgi:hypothetical protein
MTSILKTMSDPSSNPPSLGDVWWIGAERERPLSPLFCAAVAVNGGKNEGQTDLRSTMSRMRGIT